MDNIFIFVPGSESIMDIVKHISQRLSKGVKIEKTDKREIRLSQQRYVASLLKKFNMADYQEVATLLLDLGLSTSKKKAPLSEEERRQMKVP